MNMGETMTMRILRTLNTDGRINFNETLVKEVEKFIYLWSRVSSEGKIYLEFSRKIQSSSKFCKIINK
jgi:hypothetical protein